MKSERLSPPPASVLVCEMPLEAIGRRASVPQSTSAAAFTPEPLSRAGAADRSAGQRSSGRRETGAPTNRPGGIWAEAVGQEKGGEAPRAAEQRGAVLGTRCPPARHLRAPAPSRPVRRAPFTAPPAAAAAAPAVPALSPRARRASRRPSHRGFRQRRPGPGAPSAALAPGRPPAAGGAAPLRLGGPGWHRPAPSGAGTAAGAGGEGRGGRRGPGDALPPPPGRRGAGASPSLSLTAPRHSSPAPRRPARSATPCQTCPRRPEAG